jgi:hypothetical protein
MKVVIPGGTGQVGTLLSRAFQAAGHEVVVISRKPKNSSWRSIVWDAETLGDWAAELDGANVVINMAGRSVNCRYTPANRRAIMESRLKSTRVIGEAIAWAAHPPQVWLQASTATIYAHRYDAPNDEATGILGGSEPNAPDTWRFSIDVATAWEQAAIQAATPHTRKVLMRSAMIMSPDQGGVFAVLLNLVRFGLGGRFGNGQQYFSWIHDQDFIRSVFWLIEHTDIEGPVNLSSPRPIPSVDFMRTLRRAWGQPIGLPATRWMLEIGTFFVRTETELVLKSRRVVPGRMLHAGFTFQFPDWTAASRDLCQRWRMLRRSTPVLA